MSLILEALRKSEAERRRGQSPDLFTELPPALRPRDARWSSAIWVGLAAAVLAAAAWLTLELRTTPARDDRAPVSAGSNDLDAPARPAPSATATRTAGADASAPADATSVAPTPATSREAGARATVPPSAPAPQPTTPQSAGLAQPRTAPASPDTPVRDPPLPEPRDVAAVPATPPMPVTPPPGSATPTGGTLELGNLSIEHRKQLPPLRMSMHMWDADPARRFVIIDGLRRSEGDRIGEAVVERISADSVLLNWNGLRLRMALR